MAMRTAAKAPSTEPVITLERMRSLMLSSGLRAVEIPAQRLRSMMNATTAETAGVLEEIFTPNTFITSPPRTVFKPMRVQKR